MDVLALTTYDDAPFMDQQITALERRGVSFERLTVPGQVSASESRSPSDYLRYFPQVIREARNGYDLLHAHYGLTAPMALAQRRLPVVLTLWGTDLNGPAGPLTRVCAPRCDEVVVMTDGMKRTLGSDCTVIPFGIDLDLFRPRDRERARARVGWAADEHHVLFPYSPERTVKNYPRAKQIVAAVDHHVDRPVNLQVVHGVDHETVPTYMNAADALLLTSDSEGSPTSVKEALACNLPVVSLDVGDVRQRLAGVEPSRVATSDGELVRSLVEVLERGDRSNGRAAAEKVSQSVTIDRLLDVYERAVGHEIDVERPEPAVRRR
ncbi:glycosyltransferase [Halosolutus halophilus]|uniref:glycosyltransferase n=1 Tax=Halosolutus halophilus TaxID=1552990 RepID=UPI002234F3D7|nr:glycosyltransferase [Halosolutus halophilus]